jgi:hypothetical protein
MFVFAKALKLLYFAYAAFCDFSQLSDWSCEWCAKNPGVNVTATLWSNDTQTKGFWIYCYCCSILFNIRVPMIGYVGYHEAVGEIYIAFQGSHGVENWWLDLDPALIEPFKQFPKVVLHKGFYEGIGGLKDDAILLSNNTTCRLYCIEK